MRRRGKGSAFPKRRHPAYRRFIRAQACILDGRYTKVRLTLYDQWTRRGFWHVCWGPIDPSHVMDHQARGAYDVGECVPMCRATHEFYGKHEYDGEWELVTEISQKRLENEAGGYALKFVERGGVV